MFPRILSLAVQQSKGRFFIKLQLKLRFRPHILTKRHHFEFVFVLITAAVSAEPTENSCDRACDFLINGGLVKSFGRNRNFSCNLIKNLPLVASDYDSGL